MKSLFHLNKYLIKYKWKLLLGFLFIVASNIFAVYMPVIVRETTDTLVEYSNNLGKHSKSEIINYGLFSAGIFILLAIAKGLFLFFTRQTIIIVSRLIEYDLKNEIYQKYQELDYTFYKNNRIGDLMTRISEDVSKVRMYLGPGIMYTFNLTVLFSLVIYFMVSISPKLSLYVLLPLPIMSILIYWVSSIVYKKSHAVQANLSSISNSSQEVFSGIKILKAYSKEHYFSNIYAKNSNEYLKSNMAMVRINSLFMPTIFLLIGLSNIFTIYVGGMMYFEGEITLGNIIEFIYYINMLTWPFAAVGWITSIIQRAAASQDRINEFMLSESVVNENSKEPEIEKVNTISFQNISQKFEENTNSTLEDINFEIHEGEVIGIMGKTGSGKSTLVNLLLREFDASSGKILINGKEITKINLKSYRSLIGLVPQEVFLFSDTIENNIRFGSNDNKEFEEIEQATKEAGVYSDIMDFPQKFDTLLGERGVNLSGGQKQRVSIARALLKNSSIYIFDDCLSAVDTATEEHILQSIKNIEGNKTIIIVSHRVSTVKHADKILFLEKGKIIEQGTHSELKEKNGAYRKVYDKQADKES
jgi:ATP-binding cassette subfamily B protein